MSQPLVIRFGTLHDQLGPPKRDGVLLVADGRVADVDAGADGLGVPDGALVVDAACVVPGLINAHGHLEQDAGAEGAGWFARTTPTQRAITAAGQAGRAVRAGVTTLRDLGTSNRIAIEVRDLIREGKLPGPTVVAAGRVICMTGGVLTPGAVPGTQELSEEELRAGVDEAHRLGLRAAAHASGTGGIKAALRAGIDSIEHGHLIDEEGIELMLDREAYLVLDARDEAPGGPARGDGQRGRPARSQAGHAGAGRGRRSDRARSGHRRRPEDAPRSAAGGQGRRDRAHPRVLSACSDGTLTGRKRRPPRTRGWARPYCQVGRYGGAPAGPILRWSVGRNRRHMMRPVVHYLNSSARETDALVMEAIAREALGSLYTARQVLLTRGETRVLRYLPTHLSAREIAVELYLSPNTVKTHQRHLYGKLGAHSRAQAVERARALGLLRRPSRDSVRGTVYGLAR